MNVFDKSYAEKYDTMYADKNYGEECDLVEAAAAELGVPIGRLLDVGCGTGGHSLEWVRRGVPHVTGVDMSPAMIALAIDKAGKSELPVRPTFEVGDATSFDAGADYDVATFMFAVLGYLNSNEAVLAALRNVRRHLRTGGVLVFDVWYGPAVLGIRPEPRTRVLENSDGSKTIRSATTAIDTYRHLAEVTFNLWSYSGDRFLGHSTECHSMRYFFPQEIQLFLEAAGFGPAAIREFPGNGAPSDDTWNVYCVASAI